MQKVSLSIAVVQTSSGVPGTVFVGVTNRGTHDFVGMYSMSCYYIITSIKITNTIHP